MVSVKIKRKKDGNIYATNKVEVSQPGFSRRGPCWVLEPRWSGRTHYKSVAAIKAQFTYIDGSAIE